MLVSASGDSQCSLCQLLLKLSYIGLVLWFVADGYFDDTVRAVLSAPLSPSSTLTIFLSEMHLYFVL